MVHATIASDQLDTATRGDVHTSFTLSPLGYVKSGTGVELMSFGAETEQRQATIEAASSSWSFPHLMSLHDNKAASPTRTSTARSVVTANTNPDANDDDSDTSEIQTTIEEDLCLRLSNMHLTAPPSYTDPPIYKLIEHNVFGISRPPAYTPPLPGWRSTPPFNEWRYQDEDQSEWALRRRRRLVAEKLEAESRGSYVGYRTATAPSSSLTPQPLELEHAHLLRSTTLLQAYRSTGSPDELLFRRFLSTRSLFADSPDPAVGHRQHHFEPFSLRLQRFLQIMIRPKVSTPASRKGEQLNGTGTPRNRKIKPANEDVEDDERTAIPKHNPTPHLHGVRDGGCTCCPEGVVRKRVGVKGLGREGTDFRERGTGRGDGKREVTDSLERKGD